MPLQSLLSLGAAYFTLILALVVVSRDWHSFVHRIFAFGLCLLATEEFMKAFAYSTVLPVDVLYWQKRIAAVSTLGPGTWLLVSVIMR